MIIGYNKINGTVVCGLSQDQDLNVFFQNYPHEFRENLEKLYIVDIPNCLENYKVIDGELVRRSNNEIIEIQTYGYILTEEERVLNKLKPSKEEIKKAEDTIELLSLLQEVL